MAFMSARMQSVACRGIATLAAVLLASPVRASHTVFRATVDRFEAVGNHFGAGVVDEFDDGTISPGWVALLGRLGTSIVETGGVLVLQNPGVDISLVPGLALDITNGENMTDVDNGAGDFTLTSYWPLPLPAPGVSIHFELYGLGGGGIESSGMILTNLGASGLSISANETLLQGASGTPQSYAVTVDPSSASGALVLRLAFDDTADELTCSFSLDGGASFQSPFPPLHAFQAVPDAAILLGANTGETTTPPPPRTCIAGSTSGNLLVFKRRTDPGGSERFHVQGAVLASATLGLPNLTGTGVQLRIENTTTQTRLVDLVGDSAIPADEPGGGCDPRDGWSRRGLRFAYRNFSNALPPACTPGSAGGLRVLHVWRRHTLGITPQFV